MKRQELLWGLFFEKLLKNFSTLLMVSDSKGDVVFANKKYLDFFDFSKRDIIGKCWIKSLIPKDRRDAVEKVFKDIKEKKIIGRFRTPVVIRGAEEKNLFWIGVPLKEKRIMLYMFMGHDKKSVEKAKSQSRSGRLGKLDTTQKEIIGAFFEASEVSEPGTAKHALRVMSYAVTLARKLKIDKQRIENIKAASLLHDLGKLAVDRKILFKKGKLNKREFDQIKKHPEWGAEIAGFIYFLHDIIPIMISHHENYDGTGYPKGIKGEDIPLEARVLGIADVYEALTADRPYRKGFSEKEAMKIMVEEKGHRLDPKITDIFLDIIRKNNVREEKF
ncbi:MAG: HD-GYP domain-containing protein [Candidatus Omnitrophota bacterium]